MSICRAGWKAWLTLFLFYSGSYPTAAPNLSGMLSSIKKIPPVCFFMPLKVGVIFYLSISDTAHKGQSWKGHRSENRHGCFFDKDFALEYRKWTDQIQGTFSTYTEDAKTYLWNIAFSAEEINIEGMIKSILPMPIFFIIPFNIWPHNFFFEKFCFNQSTMMAFKNFSIFFFYHTTLVLQHWNIAKGLEAAHIRSEENSAVEFQSPLV